MSKSAISWAEQKLRAAQKKESLFLKEKEAAWQKNAEERAKLRALRLARDAAEKEGTETVAAAKGSSQI